MFIRFGVRMCVPLAGLLCFMPIIASAEVVNSGPSARLLSAFFGLDNALPFRANLLCLGASGEDGMPVVLSHVVDPDSLQPEDFKVVTESGAEHTPRCATPRPADDPGELRTILLIGEFGDADQDPPVTVQIVGELLAAQPTSDSGHLINFVGAQVAVTPLSDGPSLVLAQQVPKPQLALKTRGTTCPTDTEQVIRVTWSGGVRLPNREEPGDKERGLYRVEVESVEGVADEVSPTVLADLGDQDNNHLLCLDTTRKALAVSFPGGQLIDPNGDLNPASRVEVTGEQY